MQRTDNKMSEKKTTSSALIQVTSADVLLANDMRIAWTGFRPVDATDIKPTVYTTTLPGNGTGETQVSLVVAGAQAKDYPVELTLLSGAAFVDGVPIGIGVPVTLAPTNTGAEAQLTYTTETVVLQAAPQWPVSAQLRSGGGGTPPPPLPGNGSDD